MMNDKKGSILVVTIGFVLVFTLLGFGSLHYAYVQNEVVEKEKASAEAFWLADGALQMAFNNLVNDPTALIAKTDYTPNSTDPKQYDVFSEADSCPPPICTDEEREEDPELPVCTEAERLQDPILCTDADRSQDPGLCTSGSRVPDLTGCTQEDRDLNGGLCPCQVNSSCIMLCPCESDVIPCRGRCPCEYADPPSCLGRCPCETTDPQSCPCHSTDTCPDKMIGRCACEVSGSCCESWILQSYGEVNYNVGIESRAITAKAGEDLGGCDLDNAIETWGYVNRDRDCEPDGNAVIEGGCEQEAEFTFQSVFKRDKQWFLDNADHEYLNPENNFDGIVSGITVITMTGSNKSLNITEDKQEYQADGVTPVASLLIIDTTGVDSNKNVMITIAGNGVFRGIVWIIGGAQIVGTSEIQGAIFVAGDEEDETKVSGTTDIYYSTAAIQEALATFLPDGCDGGGYATGLTFISWNEEDMVSKTDY